MIKFICLFLLLSRLEDFCLVLYVLSASYVAGVITYNGWQRPMVAIFQNGRHMLVFHRILGRQVDSDRWSSRLSSAHCLPPPICVTGSIPAVRSVTFSNAKFS